MHWPSEWGGENATLDDALTVARVLAQAGAPLPLTDIGINLVGPSIMEFGSSSQKEQHLPSISHGDSIWTQLFSEPEAGSDLASLRIRATQSSDGNWRINGQKAWNTYAHIADWGYLLARTGSPEQRHRALTMFLVPMDTPGITVRPIREMTGSFDFNEVFFSDVELPIGAVLGKPGNGWTVAMSTLSQERRVVGRLVVGLEAELSRLTKVVTGLDEQLSDEYRMRLAILISEMAALTRISETLTNTLAIESIEKIAFSELNIKTSQLAIEIAAAYPEHVPRGWAMRWSDNYLNARSYTISGGANEVLRNVVAKRGLGLASSPPDQK